MASLSREVGSVALLEQVAGVLRRRLSVWWQR